MNARTLLENFEVLAEAPGGIDRLREMIIALAISGRVASTETFELDSVTDLLELAAKEIQPHPEMSEPRFEIPNHWVWVPLASIALHQLGKMLNTGKMKGQRVRYLRSVNIRQDGRIDLTDLKEMLIPINELAKYDVKLNDIFVNEGGDVGRNAIWAVETEESFAFQNQLHRLRPVCGISSRYLQLVLRDAKSRGVIAGMSSGVTIQHFSASSIRRLAIPLPPIAEQKRIIAKVDELMALCDQLEERKNQRDKLRTAARESAINAISTAQRPEELDAAWKRINKNWEVIADTPASIESLRSLILDLAINGLISGSDISSWRVTTLGDEVQIVRGITFPSSAKKRMPERGLVPCLRTANIQNEVDWDDLIYVSEGFVRNDNQYVQLDDLLISMANSKELVGKVALVRRIDFSCTLGGFIAAIRCGAGIDPKYLMTILRVPSAREKLIDSSTQTTNIANISLGRLRPFALTLPPLSEQQVIVAKVDELMALCDQLESELKTRSEVAEKFARSILEGV